MKKFYGILLCLALMAFKNSQAQTCAAVSTEPVPVTDHPSNLNRYFTVKATLNQAYNQDVTVNGSIDAPTLHGTYTLIISAGTLTAETSTEYRQPLSDNQQPITTVSSVSPCPDREARFYTSGGNNYCEFLEDQGFDIPSNLATALGVSSLSIKPGTYTIEYGSNQFGTARLDINSYSGMPNGHIDIGIRIARRISRHCHNDCECGIGFRCGFINAQLHLKDPEADWRNKNATVYIDTNTNQLIIQFIEQVDWASLD